jgi:eukaryotic-like serine/threonine-protein kinase
MDDTAPTQQDGPPGDDDEQPEPGLVRDRYVLGERLGRGGMGEVVTAFDAQIGREVAIKRLRDKRPSDRALHRFFREAAIQGRLDHPSIVPVHELGVDGNGRPFFAMKKLAGTTLAKIIAGSHSRQRVLRAFADACLAVEFAHTRNVIHRDLKPDNIVLGDFGEVYVIDWGVAKILGADTEAATAAGTAVGTPGYMSPEQARGDGDLDARTDVYSLGCVLFEILAGEPLHPRGLAGISSALAGQDARPSLRAPGRDIPPELDALCVRATAKRTGRIATAREIAEHVERYLDGDRDMALRRDLARGHLERARAAFEFAEHEDMRRTAMREAGRALALDPALAGAAELVGRLMLEPPAAPPREVENEIEADNLASVRRNARVGLLGYLGYLAFVPTLLWLAPGHQGYALALFAIIACNAGVLAWHAFGKSQPQPWRIVAGNVLLVVLLARMYSPFLIAPGVAAVTTMAVVFSPSYTRRLWVGVVVALMVGAVLVPWLAEQVGIVSATTAVGDGLALTGPALHVGATAQLLVLVGIVVALVAAAGWIAHAMRKTEYAMRHQLYVQAWQLRQLVPETRPPSHN